MHIVNSVLGDATGGRWQVVCEYSRVLSEQGHKVLLLLNTRHAPDTGLIPAGVRVEWVSNRGHFDFPAAWRVRRLLREFRPRLAIAHCSRSVALLKRAARGLAPVVAVSHSNKVRRLLPADAYLPLTAPIEHMIKQAGPPAADRPCYIVPNMIDVGTGDCPERQRHDPPRIGALGRFDPVKGFDVYIEALGLLRERGIPFQAVLGGSGEQQQALQARAQRLGLGQQLNFPGWIDNVDDFLAGIDILCVPARSDAFGLTPLQAAVAGVPMVLSRASGHCEIFSDGEQALFSPVGDAGAMANQIQQLIVNPALAEQLRHTAHRHVVVNFSSGVVTEKLLQSIDCIVKYYK